MLFDSDTRIPQKTPFIFGTDGWSKDLKYKQSPNIGGDYPKPPQFIVIHYTAGGTKSADYLCRPEAKASAHFCVTREGLIQQIVSIRKRARHAGASSWKGLQNLNTYSIGIEFENWGYLSRNAEGRYFPPSTGGKVVIPSNRVELARHKNPKSSYGAWETYTEEQYLAGVELCRALMAFYPSITGIIGHDDIAPCTIS